MSSSSTTRTTRGTSVDISGWVRKVTQGGWGLEQPQASCLAHHPGKSAQSPIDRDFAASDMLPELGALECRHIGSVTPCSGAREAYLLPHGTPAGHPHDFRRVQPRRAGRL